jgi:hypothetical protein
VILLHIRLELSETGVFPPAVVGLSFALVLVVEEGIIIVILI